MKRWIKLLLTIILFVSTLTIVSLDQAVIAYATGTGCDTRYELAWVNDNGGFDNVGCYDDFDSAKNALASSSEDHVIRHHASLSPTKIIAINSGIAYSYSTRGSSKTTLDVVQNYAAHQYRKVTYVVQHRELAMPKTSTYNGNGDGQVFVQLGGFDGFVPLKQIDLVPMKFIRNGLSLWLGGNTANNTEQPFIVKPKQSHFKVVRNGNYLDLVYYYYSGWASDVVPNENASAIGPAADWMTEGSIYYSYDYENFYRDRNYQDKAGSYYSYYQFLPARSQSNIKASTYDQYMINKGFDSQPASSNISQLKRNESKLVGMGQSFVNYQNTYGVNAALVFALACLESGNGRSQYAVERNNLFGWNAVDADPDNASSFPSIDEGVKQQMALNLRNYLDVNNAVFFGMHFGSKGSGFNVKYASDPYWGLKVASIAYTLDKLDNNYNGKLTDYNHYTVGIVDDYGTPIYEANNSNKVIHTTEYGATYQKNFTTIMLENTSNNFTKTQLANLYIDGKTVVSQSGGNRYPITAYDWSTNIGFVNTNKLRVINGNELVAPEKVIVNKVNELSILDTRFNIAGESYDENYKLNAADEIQHTLLIYDTNNGEVYDQLLMNNMYIMVDGYSYGGYYSNDYDLLKLPIGEYALSIHVKTKDYEYIKALNFDTKLSFSNYGKKYEIYSKDGQLNIKVSELILEIDNYYNLMVENLALDENGILSIDGYGLIEGVNNNEGNIKHSLDIIDNNTGQVISTYTLTSHAGAYDLSQAFSHNLDYSLAWYKGEVDINHLPIGDYSFAITTQVKDMVKSKKVYGQYKHKNINGMLLNNLYYSLIKQYNVSDRFDLIIRPYVNDFVDANLKSIRVPYHYLAKTSYDDANNILNIKGSALAYNMDFSANDEIKYNILLANVITGDKYYYQVDAVNKLDDNSSWDNTLEMDTKFNLEYSWFDIDLDLNNVKDGEYDIIMIIENNNVISSFDLTTIYDSRLIDYQNTIDNKTLSLNRNVTNRNKLSLSLMGFNK